MDERVVKALQQWPDVPDVYGWLSLDNRGQWRLRGERISNLKLVDFINRNYIRLSDGGYAFQNGPQRVHVQLQTTPWIARCRIYDKHAEFISHTGQAIESIQCAWISAQGQVILDGDPGPALLHDQDLLEFTECIASSHAADSETDITAALDDPEHHGLCLQLVHQCVPIRRLAEVSLAEHFDFIARAKPGKA